MTADEGDTFSGSDALVLEEAVRGSKASFEILYRRHVDLVYRYVRTRVLSTDAAEDVTQDVFITLWQKRSHIEIHGESLAPWLVVTARNHLLNHLRSERRGARVAEKIGVEATRSPHAAQSAEDDFIFRTDSEELSDVISSLGSLDRMIFELCQERNYSYAEAARELNLTSGAVRNRLTRARASLRRKLLESR